MVEKFESQEFRDELAEEIKKAPKEARKEVLDEAKESPEYWDARTKKVKERQYEEEINDGLGVLVKKKTLYHGSGVAGIKKFDKAEETTVGSGVYFTSEAKDAIGYARLRAERERERTNYGKEKRNENAKPIIYESSVENMKLLDLRKDENVKELLEGFKDILLKKLKEPDLRGSRYEVFKRIIDFINEGKVNSHNLRIVAFNTNKIFSSYVESLGYEGLITIEGGEGGNGNHDTYLIFDPEKVTINQEHNINIE